MVSPKNAREAALLALLEIDKKNAYAQQARNRILNSGDLALRDRAFCTELIYGVTKHRRTIDHIIETFSTRLVKKMDPITRNTLRLGVYQIVYLEQIPTHAAVDESVALAKKWAHIGSAGFVNAILRTIVRKPNAVKYPDPSREPASYISLKYSHPKWLVSRWLNRFGTAETIRLCQANNEKAPVTIRTNTLRLTRNTLLQELIMQDSCISVSFN